MSVPIYLGDSLQWEQNSDLFSRDDAVSIATTGDELVGEGGGILGDDDLVFPVSVLKDAALFDRLVSRMADLALDTPARNTAPSSPRSSTSSRSPKRTARFSARRSRPCATSPRADATTSGATTSAT